MTYEEFRAEMCAYREAIDQWAAERRDPSDAYLKLLALYRRFDADERVMANQVINEWLLSPNTTARMEAQVLIEDFGIITALPTLGELVLSLRENKKPQWQAAIGTMGKLIAKLVEVASRDGS